MSSLTLVPIPEPERAGWQARLAAFEREFAYPLGPDRFHLDHGADYFAFFDGLGSIRPYVATQHDQVIGVLVAVRRTIVGQRCWYLCDLKVSPRVGGWSVGSRLLRAWQADHRLPGEPVFGVSMNPDRGENRLARLALQSRLLGPLEASALVLFSLEQRAWHVAAPRLEAALGPLAFRDARAEKDIVLQSTGTSLPLLHLQYGSLARGNVKDSRAGWVHMFCLPGDHPLRPDLAGAGIVPTATASVLHSPGLRAWRSLLTSDI